MKKLSQIDEGWGSLVRRDLTKEVRDEDKFNPGEIIDLGGSVIWAANSLEIDGINKFTYDEVKDFNKDGWRLPTLREVEESNWDKNPFTNHMDGEFIIRLWRRGTFIIKDAGWDIRRQFTCMTSDQKGDEVICYGCYSGQGYFKIFPDSKQSKYFVFLVKSK